MNRIIILALSVFCVSVLSAVEVKAEDSFIRTYLVLRMFTEDSAAARENLQAAHHAHTLQMGRDITTFRMLDDAGNVTGLGAWMAFETREALQVFLDADPYQREGIFQEVTVSEAHLYILDEWFAIAPSWRDQEALREAHSRYDEQVRRFVRE